MANTQLNMMNNDAIAQNINKIKELFPHCVCEVLVDGKLTQAIDHHKLLLELGIDNDHETKERYEFNWPNKREAIKLANLPTSSTLRPCLSESIDFEHTQNLYIEGDNLEVLKCIKNTYLNKIKLIYIDPPYNTGSDLIYHDDFDQSAESFLVSENKIDEQGNRLSSNLQSEGRFHTNWLNMIYPRLKIARDLLTDDGAIFISIDENEMDNLKKVCDEIFGQSNFIASLVWAAGRKNDSKLISVSHEYIVCYARNKNYLKENSIVWRERKQGLDDIYKEYERLKKLHGDNYKLIEQDLKLWYKSLPPESPAKNHNHYTKVDCRGIYYGADISWPGGGGPKYTVLHPITNKPVKVPTRGWLYTKDKLNSLIADDRILFGADENYVPQVKAYLKDREYAVPYSVFYTDGRAASKRLVSLLGDKVFDNPKDETIIARIIEFCGLKDNDIVLDFFSGSGTTAHALFLANMKQKLNRHFILVQIPEAIGEKNAKSEKAKNVTNNAIKLCQSLNAPANICTIAKERIKKAGQQVLAMMNESLSKAKNQANLSAENRINKPFSMGGGRAVFDCGFRVLKLDSSNMKDVFYYPNELSQANLLDSIDNIKVDRTPEDLLFQIMLELGIDLTSSIAKINLSQDSAYIVGSTTTTPTLLQEPAPAPEFTLAPELTSELAAAPEVASEAAPEPGLAVATEPFLACYFSNELKANDIITLAKLKPVYLVLKNSAISSDSLMTNYDQLIKAHSPETIVKTL